ncbi:unnamed protein product [Alopecurus aequalis]
MERSSSSLVLAVAILSIICCSLPCSVAIRVHPDGYHGGGVGPPSPRPGTSVSCIIECGYTNTTPRATSTTALTPHRKTQQQAVENDDPDVRK